MRRLSAIAATRNRAAVVAALALAGVAGTSGSAQAMRRGCAAVSTTDSSTTASPKVGSSKAGSSKAGRSGTDVAARTSRRCAKTAKASGPAQAKAVPGGKAPAIESSGVSPAADNTLPLLKPGTFRFDIAAFAAEHPLFGIGAPRPSRTDLYETFTLGYGVNPRLTVFAGALEVNSDRGSGPYQADYIDPKVGFIYRLATAPEFRGNTLDFAGDVTVNEPFGNAAVFGGIPVSQLGPVGRARLLLTRQITPNFSLEGIGGFQAAQVTTDYPFGGLTHTATDVDALLGLAGQYRLGYFSNRLYVNGELDFMQPLTSDANQVIVDTPFKTTQSYAATIGATYVLKPGSILVRATNTLTLDNGSSQQFGPTHYSSRQLYNTAGLTLSFINLEPPHWLKSLAP